MSKSKDRSWYRLTFPGMALISPISPERAEALQAAGYHLDPASPPADAAERIAAVVAALLQPGIHRGIE